jgi:hypothetical protein
MDWLKTVIELTDPRNARQAIEDAETIDALDFAFAPQCEGSRGQSGCEREAVWLARTRCCGLSSYACDEHRKITELQLDEPKRCGTCKTAPCPGVLWYPLSESS